MNKKFLEPNVLALMRDDTFILLGSAHMIVGATYPISELILILLLLCFFLMNSRYPISR